MSTFDRRAFLRRSAAAAGGLVLAGPAFHGLAARSALAASPERQRLSPSQGGYGPLQPVPDLRDGVRRLSLPDGFHYQSFGIAGTLMSDGNLTPLAHDAMAAFALPNGQIALVRNHEDRNPPGAGSVTGDPATKYDPLGGGGTTTLIIDPASRRVIRDFVSLNGTTVNCAGGRTGWTSWLTCEETTQGRSHGWGQPHGYVFEVPASADGPVPAVALKDLGRFVHEATLVDPSTGIAYETEDRGNVSGFYRFLPNRPGNLAAGGRLQMLAVRGQPNYVTYLGQEVGKPLPVEWVDIPNPDPAEAEQNPSAVFEQGAARGGAAFSRLEGIWYDGDPGRGQSRGRRAESESDGRPGGGRGSIFFASTSGGEAGLGQIWEYRPQGNNGGQLILLFESTSPEVLDSPDNLCVSPRGGLVLCEDGDGEQYLRGLTQRGEIFDFALNLEDTYEWAGATFSPDGQTLFVNNQGTTRGPNPPPSGQEGMTFAIWGPWERGAL